MASDLRRLSFEETAQGVSAFLEEAVAARAECRKKEEEALAEVLKQHTDELRGLAEKTHEVIAAAKEVLLPQIKEGQALAQDSLQALNEAVRSCEAPYGAPNGKTDQIPEQLCAAAPGTKLFPNLVKKVGALCARTIEQLQQRCTDALSERLLEGGKCEALDVARKDALSCCDAQLQGAWERYAVALAQSDHLPLEESVETEDGKSWVAFVWNVLEFPSKAAEKPLVDGVFPYSEQLQKAAGHKGTEERELLLKALSSEVVVSSHYSLILQEVKAALLDRGASCALLQELSSEFAELLSEECVKQGWDLCLGRGSQEPGKCEAITAVVSKVAVDEKEVVQVQEEKKTRGFAAGRIGGTWLLSCHVPHEQSPKKKGDAKDTAPDTAARVLKLVTTKLLGEGAQAGRCLIAGGDFNADVHAVQGLLQEEQKTVSLATLPTRTQFDTAQPIDGLFRLSASSKG